MHHLIFFQNTNDLILKSADNVFIPEAKALEQWCNANGHSTFMLGLNGKSKDKTTLKAIIAENLNLSPKIPNVISFISHGYKNGFQLGFKGENEARLLAAILAPYAPRFINFYACYCAVSFAPWLLQYLKPHYSLLDYSPQIMAHTTKGHATMNPNIKVFTSKEVYSPYNKQDVNYWMFWFAMRVDEKLRFAFPYMALREIDMVVKGYADNDLNWGKMKKLRKKLLGF